MLECFQKPSDQAAIPIIVVEKNQFPAWLASQPKRIQTWMNNTQFRPEPGKSQLIPNENGEIEQVVTCIDAPNHFWQVGHLAHILPEGVYTFDLTSSYFHSYALAWGLGAYQFTNYKKPTRMPAKLILTSQHEKEITNILEAIYLVRDCINTPTDDMGPSEFANVAKQVANEFDASINEIIGEDLLKQNFAAIYTVGRASDDAPRLLDFRWGDSSHPKVTLIGKGVCFDTGGLDIKPSQYMLLMKKDMGGAAHVLGLARMIMKARLPISLRILIPLVENSISANAYRPGDVIKSRKGLTIEIGNTDAEGRVILADALSEAADEEPDLIIDMATLTGAARVALGSEIAVVFSNHDETVNELLKISEQISDPIWRLPLYQPYRDLLFSSIADINNNAIEPYAGAITAALFLKEFVPDNIPWLHFDIMAWNLRTKPGRPEGGEAVALRALFTYLKNRFIHR